MNEKSYGKLTVDQFRRVVKALPDVRAQMKELPELVSGDSERLRKLLGPNDHSWAEIYELAFIEQMALLFVIVGLHAPIIEASRCGDLHEELLTWLTDDSKLDGWYEANKDKIEKKHLLWLVVVLQRNILSIMLFHQSMAALVEAVRHGNDEAFFKAVRVDRCVLCCPTFADRVSRAELKGDKQFFLHLRSALKGPSKKHMEAIQDLRYSIYLLRDMGFDKFSDAELERLFIATRLYPNSPGALKNLRKHIRESRRFSTT